jgi:hypothetical protein
MNPNHMAVVIADAGICPGQVGLHLSGANGT